VARGGRAGALFRTGATRVAGGRSTLRAGSVPELTCSSGIQLNKRILSRKRNGRIIRGPCLPEGWLSGLRRCAPGAIYGQPYRRFESFPPPPRLPPRGSRAGALSVIGATAALANSTGLTEQNTVYKISWDLLIGLMSAG
jgi:hypothetical protein